MISRVAAFFDGHSKSVSPLYIKCAMRARVSCVQCVLFGACVGGGIANLLAILSRHEAFLVPRCRRRILEVLTTLVLHYLYGTTKAAKSGLFKTKTLKLSQGYRGSRFFFYLLNSEDPTMLAAAFFICAFSLVGFGATHDDDLHTIKYTEGTFAAEVPKKNHFVMFYAPWCGHCQRLAPTWDTLAEMLNEEEDNRVKIAKVDCTTDSAVCSEHDVTGYPTLKFFKAGESEGIKFRGTRDLPSLTAFINEQSGSIPSESESAAVPEPVNGLRELTEETFDKHVSSGHHFVKFYAPWCGHCQKLAPTWDDLAHSYGHDDYVSIAKVDCTQHRAVCEQFDVKGYPTLLWIEDGKKIEKYTGQRSHEELKAYVDKMLHKNDKETGSDEETDESVQSVLTLSGENFKHGIQKGITFIEFFAPWCGHCKRLAPTWEELGKKFIGNENVHIVKVDCTLGTSKQLCDEQEVDGFPTLLLYRDGEKVSEYNGSRTLEDLYEFVYNHLNSHDEL